MILGYPLADWTGGFNAWRQLFEGIELSTVRSNGYSFQIELKYRALKKGFRVRLPSFLKIVNFGGQAKCLERLFSRHFIKYG